MSTVPIADHAFLSDGRTGALVTRDGSIDWLCLPRFDSPAVLARLLDDEAGHLLVRPADPAAVPTRRYLPQTLVLETTWTCSTGRVQVVDALALGPDERGHDIGAASPGVLLRTATCVDGEVDLEVAWAPRPEFGLVHPILEEVPGGVLAVGAATQLVLSIEAPLTLDGASARGRIRLTANQRLAVAMEQADGWSPPVRPWTAAAILSRLRDTEAAWRSWSDLHQSYRGPHRDLVHRSGLVLQGLTYAHTGAVVAAATTSLPEGVGTGRTWDYRFTWVRDASLTLRGLYVAACPDEAGRFFAFLARAAATQLRRGVPLQIMYGIGGERDLTERELPHLAGWRDSRPVRVGNGAWGQRQQDVYGALLDAAWELREQLGDIEGTTRRLLVDAVETVCATWREPDAGIWEVRGPLKRYLHSALLGWVALDRGVRLAELLGVMDRLPRWTEVREEIAKEILERGWNPRVGAFTQSFGSDELDAAVLLVALVGFLPADDPRIVATVDAVRRALSDERGLVLRYRGDDGLEGAEGSFLLCTFWLAEALARTGRPAEAAEVLDRAAGSANDLGLLAEEVDASTGELLGNFPQAFSHLGLVLAAQAIADADVSEAPRGA
ncbi:glycoside hydrolase family 15 protein [Amnibacterium sp. CER49]|uniref:glycoside hydrolase family 15 protein n=1 Tax=Amnibacterium sp. CER49 TaxID=3039161 RepID=UPI00244A7D1B|nr:glycoside hydrolase family 15 protein [Amnibacterium sp. CER49]MDH2442423.1 glycoside hydrolase family 15 protein [Amnibacterium sp. CER49]